MLNKGKVFPIYTATLSNILNFFKERFDLFCILSIQCNKLIVISINYRNSLKLINRFDMYLRYKKLFSLKLLTLHTTKGSSLRY